MAYETRVNLRHLLEDIRDTYTAPLEEVIVTELITNALDSKANNIYFEVNAKSSYLRCVDDGLGMKRTALKNYHNIAASSKTRGEGIGFAGVGAKLALLLAQKVVTESRGGHGSQSAAEWYLATPYRAPWKFVPFSQSMKTARGTSVTVYFGDRDSHLLKPEFIEQTIMKHFYPLLSPSFYRNILKYFYKKPVYFSVNERRVDAPLSGKEELQNWFRVRLGKSRQSLGVGFLAKTESQPGWLDNLLGRSRSSAIDLLPGLWISTFGKVIKGGWEWLGVLPKSPDSVIGLVEIPMLSEILTTNKSDFLSDAASLKKYYRIRKAIQEAVLPILQNIGEDPTTRHFLTEKSLRPLHRSITNALSRMVDDFPELEGLINTHRSRVAGKKQIEKDDTKTSILIPAEKERRLRALDQPEDVVINTPDKKTPRVLSGVADASKKQIVRAKTAGLRLSFAEITDTLEMPLGRILQNTLTINTAHPAWKKAKQKGLEEYHVLATVAIELSRFLESEKTPQDFLNQLLLAWSKETRS